MLKAKKMNIDGYLLKDEPFSEIKKCIKSVLKNQFYASAIFDEIFNNQVSPELEKIKFLSPSERTIVRLISKENSSKQIAETLSISSRTVEKHRSNIISKLDLTSGSESLTKWITKNKDLIEFI